MQLERDDAGDLWFRGISPLHADTLLQVPSWLRSDDPRVRERLLPPAYDTDDDEEHWRRYVCDDLAHLFESRAEIVQKDLEGLVQEGPFTYALHVPCEHAPAWLAALNGARLALFELHDLDAEDMDRDPSVIGDFEQELTLLRIHIMAYMQELMIEAGV